MRCGGFYRRRLSPKTDASPIGRGSFAHRAASSECACAAKFRATLSGRCSTSPKRSLTEALSLRIDTGRTWHLDLLGLVNELRDESGTPRRYPVRLLEALLEATKTDRLMQGILGPDRDEASAAPPDTLPDADLPLVSLPSA